MAGIEDIAALLPRAPQQAQLKDYGQIQDQISQTRENNARAQALQQATLEAQRVQQDRIKKQQAWNQAMSQAKDLDDAANQYAKISGDVESAQKVLEGLSQTRAHLATATNQDLESQVKRDQIITGRLEGIIDPKNPEKTWFEYQRSAPELQQMGVPKFTSPDQIQAYYRTHQLGGTLPKQELENRKVTVDEQRANTDAAKQTLEARDKDLALAYQDLSAVQDQATYDQWRQAHPDQAKQISPIYNPMMIKSELRKAVPIAKQMEFEDKAADNARQAGAAELAAKREAELERHNRASEERMAQLASQGIGQQQATRINQVASQFDNEPLVRDYNQIAEAKQFVDKLGTGKGATATNDQGLIYAFAKAMDPGSVVREGEYATVQKYSQSWADKFGFQAQRIFSNSPFLTEEARKQMKDTIAQKLNAVKGQYDNVHSEYARRINKVGGVQDGSEYLTDYSKFSNDAKPPGKKITKVEEVIE